MRPGRRGFQGCGLGGRPLFILVRIEAMEQVIEGRNGGKECTPGFPWDGEARILAIPAPWGFISE